MIDSSPAQRPERISYGGKSYQVTQIIEINGQNATLRTTDNKSITVPIRFLTTRLKGQVEKLQKQMLLMAKSKNLLPAN